MASHAKYSDVDRQQVDREVVEEVDSSLTLAVDEGEAHDETHSTEQEQSASAKLAVCRILMTCVGATMMVTASFGLGVMWNESRRPLGLPRDVASSASTLLRPPLHAPGAEDDPSAMGTSTPSPSNLQGSAGSHRPLESAEALSKALAPYCPELEGRVSLATMTAQLQSTIHCYMLVRRRAWSTQTHPARAHAAYPAQAQARVHVPCMS